MDITSFTNWGGPGGGRGALSVQKNEKIKNSTHTKIQFYIISMFFFSMMDITIFTDGFLPWVRRQAVRGCYPFIKMRKSQEQYPY